MAIDAGQTPPHSADDAEEILQAKYLEYCSAQLADLLLYLSPDEIYLLAERAERDEGLDAPVAHTYTGMVERATRWLARRVALPPFEVWREDYRLHRDRYEAYLMGLWEADAPPAPASELDA